MMLSRTGHSPFINIGWYQRRFLARSKLAFMKVVISPAISPRSVSPAGVSQFWPKPASRAISSSFTCPSTPRMREPTPCLSRGPLRSSSSTAPECQLRHRRNGPSPLAIRATMRVLIPATFFFSPVSPLAASTMWASVDKGTTWPSTKPPATSARRNGHGLSGETGICPAGVPFEPVPLFSAGMNGETRIVKLIGRDINATSPRVAPLQDVQTFPCRCQPKTGNAACWSLQACEDYGRARAAANGSSRALTRIDGITSRNREIERPPRGWPFLFMFDRLFLEVGGKELGSLALRFLVDLGVVSKRQIELLAEFGGFGIRERVHGAGILDDAVIG